MLHVWKHILINCRHIDENSWNSWKNPKLEIFGMEKFGFGYLIDMVIYALCSDPEYNFES